MPKSSHDETNTPTVSAATTPQPGRSTSRSRKGASEATASDQADENATKPEAPDVCDAPTDQNEDEETFVETLIATGQAAPLDEDGKLPPGATHELVETKEGEPTVVRRRFSLY